MQGFLLYTKVSQKFFNILVCVNFQHVNPVTKAIQAVEGTLTVVDNIVVIGVPMCYACYFCI